MSNIGLAIAVLGAALIFFGVRVRVQNEQSPPGRKKTVTFYVSILAILFGIAVVAGGLYLPTYLRS